MKESSTSAGGGGISKVPSRGSPFGSISGCGKMDISIAPHSLSTEGLRPMNRSPSSGLQEHLPDSPALTGRIARASLTKLTEGRICPYVALFEPHKIAYLNLCHDVAYRHQGLP